MSTCTYYSVLRSSKCVLMQIKPLINRIAPPNSTQIYLPSASLVFTSFATFYSYTFCCCACSIFYPLLLSHALLKSPKMAGGNVVEIKS